MTTLTLPISLVVAHFIADFLLQSDWMALNKSKSFKALNTHVSAYSAVMMLWAVGHLNEEYVRTSVILFTLVTYVTHFVTDAITSRLTSKLWFIDFYPRPHKDNYGAYELFAHVNGKRHWFFVMIGLDQVIHYVTLALTLRFLS